MKEVRLLSVLGENYLQMEGVSDNHCSVILTSHLKAVSDNWRGTETRTIIIEPLTILLLNATK